MFEDETMGPEHMAKQERVQALLNGNDADYDRFSRSGSFADDSGFDDQPMRRGSVAADEGNFLAVRPNTGLEGPGFGQSFFAEDDSDSDAENLAANGSNLISARPNSRGVARGDDLSTIREADSEAEEDGVAAQGAQPRAQRSGSMRRAGAPSLEPMAFGRERAGTTVGWKNSPFTPDIYRNHEEEDIFDGYAARLKERSPELDHLKINANFLRGRMEHNPGVLDFGDGEQAPERGPLTQAQMFEEGEKLDYQQDEKDVNQRYLSETRHHNYWTKAHPNRPNQGAFMSKPDAGWDRVKSRGFLGLPWFASMLGSKLFGMKGGRYDQRKSDLARRNGTFERARETYGSRPEGRKGVTPDWINESNWAREKWASAERQTNPAAHAQARLAAKWGL
jgi:hypothetical protein